MPIKYWKTTFLIGIGLILLSYFLIDVPLALKFEHLSPSMRKFFDLINELANPVPHALLWVVAYYFFRFLFKKLYLSRKIMLIAITINLSNTVSVILKVLFSRARPQLLFAQHWVGYHYLYSPDLNLSFPSGHAVTIAAIAASISCLYPRFTWLFLTLGFLIAFCRVVVSAHYLSDVVAGFLLGIFVVQCVYLSMKKEIRFSQ